MFLSNIQLESSREFEKYFHFMERSWGVFIKFESFWNWNLFGHTKTVVQNWDQSFVTWHDNCNERAKLQTLKSLKYFLNKFDRERICLLIWSQSYTHINTLSPKKTKLVPYCCYIDFDQMQYSNLNKSNAQSNNNLRVYYCF